MKRILIFSLTLLVIAGCRQNKTFIVEGSLKGSRQEYIYLSRIDINVPVIVDSSKISGQGTFRFKTESTEPDFYQLGLSQTNYANLLAEPGEKIRIDFADTNLYRNYTVSGSKGSELLQILDLQLIETKQQLDSVSALYIKASGQPDFAAKGPVLEEEYLKIARAQRNFNIAFILENMKSLSSIKALYQEIEEGTYVLYEPRDLQYLKIVSDSLKKYHPASKHTKALVSNFEKELNEFNARRLQVATNDIPETILDPDLKDINGKRISLSSLRGKYVLLAFWSARSRECISDNLQLKEFYRVYSKKGFEIYQINLDEDETVWRNAVKFDELPWINTREDDPADPKNARLYNVQTLPMNYLYDPQGSIIGTNLHGRSLQIKLSQIFRN